VNAIEVQALRERLDWSERVTLYAIRRLGIAADMAPRFIAEALAEIQEGVTAPRGTDAAPASPLMSSADCAGLRNVMDANGELLLSISEDGHVRYVAGERLFDSIRRVQAEIAKVIAERDEWRNRAEAESRKLDEVYES
jgi:hypothetical protein